LLVLLAQKFIKINLSIPMVVESARYCIIEKIKLYRVRILAYNKVLMTFISLTGGKISRTLLNTGHAHGLLGVTQ